jgi:EmrB/QacA subfamily drug resistance transporter
MTSIDRKWWALALLCAVQFMTVLDVAVVNVALPSIKDDLGMSQESLQWVVSAYALTFAGFLLLGGRAADLFGRRRMFVAGLLVFASASLAAGLGWSSETLVGARALQGVGAAMLAPAALAILMTTFAEGRDRTVALGVWGSMGGAGAAAGVLLGGVLTDALGWQSIFLVNLPVVVVALAATPLVLSGDRPARGRRFDFGGALLGTAGLSATVLAITRAESAGWTSGAAAGLVAIAATLLVAFAAVELRAADPLLPLSLLRSRSGGAANLLAVFHGMGPFATFLLLTLYMQQVLGFSAAQTGAAFLAVAGSSIFWSSVASRLVASVGVKPVLVTGRILLVVALLSFTQVPVEGSYLRDVLPGMLIIGIGMPFSYVAISVAALAGIEARDAGVGSALVSTSQQIGAALGIAILSSVAATQTSAAARSGDSLAPALVSGFHAGFWVGAAIAAIGLVASAWLIQDERPERERCVDCSPATAAA